MLTKLTTILNIHLKTNKLSTLGYKIDLKHERDWPIINHLLVIQTQNPGKRLQGFHFFVKKNCLSSKKSSFF